MTYPEVARTDWSALPAGYFSPSQAWSFIACGACYEAERILKIPKPVSADLLIGRFAHASVAHMRAVLTPPLEDGQRLGATITPTFSDECVGVGSDAFDHILSEQMDVEETGEATPIEVELTKKYADLGEAKDVAARLTRYILPTIAEYDRTAGVLAAEARVWHLGPSLYGYPELYAKLSDDEKVDAEQESEEQFVGGIEPVFPFPMKAFLDVIYASRAIKDLKTSSRNGSPDALASLQLLLYGMPFWAASDPHKLGFDVAIKTKNPDFATYWLNGTGDVTDEQYEYARWRVLQAADDICAGRFRPADGNLFCRYDHGLPKGERAVMNFPVAV